MVTRGRHRLPALPFIRSDVVHLVRAERQVGLITPADHVELPAALERDRRGSLARHWRKLFPRIGNRVVFPRLESIRLALLGSAAKNEDVSAILAERHVIGGPWRRLLRRPLVGGEVVLEDAVVLAPLITTHQVQLPVRDSVPILLFGIWVRCEFLLRDPSPGRL